MGLDLPPQLPGADHGSICRQSPCTDHDSIGPIFRR